MILLTDETDLRNIASDAIVLEGRLDGLHSPGTTVRLRGGRSDFRQMTLHALLCRVRAAHGGCRSLRSWQGQAQQEPRAVLALDFGIRRLSRLAAAERPQDVDATL